MHPPGDPHPPFDPTARSTMQSQSQTNDPSMQSAQTPNTMNFGNHSANSTFQPGDASSSSSNPAPHQQQMQNQYTYPSLNYPQDQSQGYMSYPGQGPDGWSIPPSNFYQPQNLPPHPQHNPAQNFQSRPYNNQRNFSNQRFPNNPNHNQPRQNPFPMNGQPGGYPQQQPQTYYPQMYPPQMGGPGPGTMQNGYGGGYPMDMPPYMKLPFNPTGNPAGPGNMSDGMPKFSTSSSSSEMTDPSSQFSKSQSNGLDHSDKLGVSPKDIPPYHQHPQIPAIPPPLGPGQNEQSYQPAMNGPPGSNGMNGGSFSPQFNGNTPNIHSPPPPQPPSFQSFYPPNHPYAYGGGVGYPPYMPPQGMYNPYPDPGTSPNQNFAPPLGHPLPPPQPPQQSYRNNLGGGKGLNPAAAGFNFVPASQRGPPIPLAHGGPGFPPSDIQAPSESSGPVSATASSFDPHLPNGHSDHAVASDWNHPRPNLTDSQTSDPTSTTSTFPLSSLATANESNSTPLGLGLEHMQSSQSSDVVSQPPSAPLTISESTPAMSLSPTTPTTPVSLRTPRVVSDASISMTVSPKVGAQSPNPNAGDGHFNFVGPTLSGYTSPSIAAPTTPSISQALSSLPPAAQPAKPKTAAAARPRTMDVLKLALGPPAVETAENTYALEIRGNIPKTLKTEVIEVPESTRGTAGKTRRKHRSRPMALPTVFTAGATSRHAISPPGLLSQVKLVFGSTDQSEVATSLRPSTPPSIAPTAVSTPLPKVKPSSWAALLKPEGSVSASTSTRNVSPSTSVAPLSPTSNAGSVLPSISDAQGSSDHHTDAPTFTTPPKDGTARQAPPTPASLPAAPGPSRPRPVFNYAAAAAAGASMTPEQELVKLLGEGIKGKGKDIRGTLPRGLINTGNMCFANTVSCHIPSHFLLCLRVCVRYCKFWCTVHHLQSSWKSLGSASRRISLVAHRFSKPCKHIALFIPYGDSGIAKLIGLPGSSSSENSQRHSLRPSLLLSPSLQAPLRRDPMAEPRTRQ